MIRSILFFAGLLGAIGVGVGAFAAHGLEEMLSEQGLEPSDVAKRMEQCDVAVKYHLLHALAILTLGCTGRSIGRDRAMAVSLLFALGLVLFSGGLYSMVFLGEMGHWAIVPTGGLCFIVAWLGLNVTALLPLQQQFE